MTKQLGMDLDGTRVRPEEKTPSAPASTVESREAERLRMKRRGQILGWMQGGGTYDLAEIHAAFEHWTEEGLLASLMEMSEERPDQRWPPLVFDEVRVTWRVR